MLRVATAQSSPSPILLGILIKRRQAEIPLYFRFTLAPLLSHPRGSRILSMK